MNKHIGGALDRFGSDRRLIAVLCFVALFAILTYCHAVLKILIVEPNFGDFGNYYFNATKLNEGVKCLRPERRRGEPAQA